MNSSIYKLVSSRFKLDLHGDHGISHWKRVEKVGLFLSKNYKQADIEVIRLFALIHDSQRKDELTDPVHGARASKFAKELYDKKVLKISRQQLENLMHACKHHSNKKAKSDDITIQICWDSDRLDLIRLGIQPEAVYLYTNLGKKIAERGGI